MGWSIGFDEKWNRDIGYGVPAYCDHPECNEEIDRGLAFVCGNEPYGGDRGCGLFFCGKHKQLVLCERCAFQEKPFEPKPEHPLWINHVLTDESCEHWRKENPDAVRSMTESLTPPPGDTKC